ncbi:U6 snRNA phosphodiesterase Usb1 [Lactarius deliciosus]|nr:U6 snRNA phosphodiesterase Usb1 [Lactarius deliciosus]
MKEKYRQCLLPSRSVGIPDPSKHQGRTRALTRAIPHVEGQWAAHAYVSLVLRGALRGIVERAVSVAKQEVAPNPDSVAAVRELHVSLTRPFLLRAHQKEEMKRAVRDAAKAHPPFTASFAAFSDLTNDEHTRTFLCMEVGAGHGEVLYAHSRITPALLSFHQKEYYEQPRFHASFAWVLLERPPQPTLSETPEPPSPSPLHHTSLFPTVLRLPETTIPVLNASLGSQLKGSAVVFEVGEVRIRIGKDVFSWELSG